MGKFDGKVYLVTGAARGQGRSHAVALAKEGADIIGVDICEDIPTNRYPLARPDDLEETARLVKEEGRSMHQAIVDVRDLKGLEAAVRAGVEVFGRLDGVVANAGICDVKNGDPLAFTDAANTIFCGVANAVAAGMPHLTKGGSIVATGSIAALMTHSSSGVGAIAAGGLAYMWGKRTVATYINDLALALAPHGIRANCVHPTNVNTDMLHSLPMRQVFRPDIEEPTMAEAQPGFESLHPMPGVGFIEPEDVTAAVLYLLSDDARYVTGSQMRVDAGAYIQVRPPVVPF